MAKSIVARRRGDDYQSRHFWLSVLPLRTSDYVKTVTFESEDIAFVDDIVVDYALPVRDPIDGIGIGRDLYQCKYHMTAAGSFSVVDIPDPEFLGGKRSLIARAHKAFLELSSDGGAQFRIWILSNWIWHPEDVLAKHFHENAIRTSFFEGGAKSKEGLARRAIADHVGLSEDALKPFLSRMRFRLGHNLTDLQRELDPLIRLAGLLPSPPDTTGSVYDDLPWKLLGQDRRVFDRHLLDALINQEHLLAPPPGGGEISLRSFAQHARRPEDLQTKVLDLCNLFDERHPKTETVWSTEVPKSLENFIRNEDLTKLPKPIRTYFDSHLTIAFLFGHLNDPKYALRVVPVQKGGPQGYEEWPEVGEDASHSSAWTITSIGTIADEAILAISVTQEIMPQLQRYLSGKGIELPMLVFTPDTGVGPRAVTDGTHAWTLGGQLAREVKRSLPPTCRKLHVFMSVPAALAYILGHRLRWTTPQTQLYEHDFEGRRVPERYYPSTLIS